MASSAALSGLASGVDTASIVSRPQGIYVWSTPTLIKARLDQDAEAIETVAELFGELREAWA